MQIKRHQSLLATKNNPTVVTIGKFDGLHLGHQHILKRVDSVAKEHGLTSTVISFYSPPITFFNPKGSYPKIHSFRQKVHLLKSYNIQQLQLFNFNKSFSEITAEEFVNNILIKQLNTKILIIGEDAAVGHAREGNASYLQEKLSKQGAQVEIIKLAANNKQKIGSKYLVQSILAGDLLGFKQMTGRNMSFLGKVIRGGSLAKQLGYPTANLSTNQLALPPYGVYQSQTILNGNKYNSITNIGIRPTIHKASRPLIETHLIDYSEGSFYQETIEVELLEFIRSEKKFNSLDDLKNQIQQDLKRCTKRKK